MFKTGFIIFSAAAAMAASIVQADSKTFKFDGSHASAELTLSSTEGHTIYETRYYEDTCYRDEQQGYRQECHQEVRTSCTPILRRVCEDQQVCGNVPDQICINHPGGVRECRPITRHECHNETTCRDVPDEICQTVPYQACESVPNIVSVAYSCTKSREVAVGYKQDYQDKGEVLVRIGKVPAGIKPNEEFTVTLDGQNTQIELSKDSHQLLMSVTESIDRKITENDTSSRPGAKIIRAIYDIELESPVSDIDMNLKGQVLFSVARVANPKSVNVHLLIKKEKFILGISRGYIKIFEGDVPATALNLQNGAQKTQAIVDLEAMGLGNNVQGGHFDVTIDVTAKLDDSRHYLNGTAVPQELKATGNKIIKD